MIEGILALEHQNRTIRKLVNAKYSLVHLLNFLLLVSLLLWYPTDDDQKKMRRLIDRKLSGIPMTPGETRDWLIQVWRLDRSLKSELWIAISEGIDHADYKELRRQYVDVAHHEMNNMLRWRDRKRKDGER